MRKKVTISTITANRRRFFSHTIHNVLQQSQSDFDIEWVIVEDGEETIEDLVSGLGFVQYVRLEGKNSIGMKRNIANQHSGGDFILYFDDDNYAFPHRTNVAVNSLANSDLTMAGSSDMLILDGGRWEVFQVGPYSERHATLGTWCIKRELLEYTQFCDSDMRGEEVAFTKEWSVPVLQLGALNTSISFSHNKNTVPKDDLRDPWTPCWKPEAFITCEHALSFYRSIS